MAAASLERARAWVDERGPGASTEWLAMRALVVSGAHPPLESSNLAASTFLQAYAHPLLAGPPGAVEIGLFAVGQYAAAAALFE